MWFQHLIARFGFVREEVSDSFALTVSESLGSEQAAVHAVAGEMKGIIDLSEGLESDSSKHLVEFTPEFVAVTRATAGSSSFWY